MVRKKDSFWEHAEEIENGRFFICKFCQKRLAGGISRIKSHLAGVRGRDIQICLQVPKGIQTQAQQAIDPPTKRAKIVLASNNVLEGDSISGSSSSHMSNLCKAHAKSKVDEQLAKFFMLHGICSKASTSLFFANFVKGVAEHGPGYKLPRFDAIDHQLMPDIKKEVDEYVQNVIKCSVKTGCTLMYNLWGKKNFMVIFVYTPVGTTCIDPSMCFIKKSFQDVFCIEKTMSSIMELIGHTNVVQLIINGNYDVVSSTKDMLCSKYPRIYQTRSAAQGIELLLENIEGIPFLFNTFEVAALIVLYINKHKVNVSLRRLQGHNYFHYRNVFKLISLLEVESELQALQESIATLSSDWGKPCNHHQAAKNSRVALFIDSAIHCKEFWRRGKMVAQVMQPLIQIYNLVHCDLPTSGYLYEMMERVQDAVEQCRDSNYVLYDCIGGIFEEFRSEIIHPIHAAAAFLNPIYMCSEKFMENVEMTGGLNYILEHLVAVKEKKDFVNQVQLYRMKDPNVFTAQAMMMLETCHPRIWWECCGNHLPVLQTYAIRILSQPCSTFFLRMYELADWNTDNPLMLNAMMMDRYKLLEKQMIEPIILDKLGEVSDDVNDPYLCDEEVDDDQDYEHAIKDLSDSVVHDIRKDPTGSWLDRLPWIK